MIDLDSASKAELNEIVQECYVDRKFACKILFPELFELPFSEKIHDKIFDMIQSGVQKGAIAAPRGIGKTSIVNIAIPGTEILFRTSKFIVPVSATNTLAVMQSENLKFELKSNDNIRKLFGNLESRQFSKEQWTANNFEDSRFPGTCVMPRGAGQQVRGLNYFGMRPDFLIVDDLEDPEQTDSEEQRAKKLKWFYADLLKTVPRYKKDWRVFVIGTILHEDSLLNNLLESPDWESELLELCDDNLESHWPEFIPTADIKKDYAEHERLNMLDVWYRENRNLPGVRGLSGFDAKDWVEYNELDPNDDFHKRGHLPTAVIVDPAKTVTLNSAESAIVCVSVDVEQGVLWWRETLGLKLHPDELYDVAHDMAVRRNADIIAVEETSLNEFITKPFTDLLARRGWRGQFLPLKARGKKEERIRALVPYSRQGQMRFNKGSCERLKAQLLGFPRSKLVDVSDAAAYVVKLMEEGHLEIGFLSDDQYNSPDTIAAELRLLDRLDRQPAIDSFRII